MPFVLLNLRLFSIIDRSPSFTKSRRLLASNPLYSGLNYKARITRTRHYIAEARVKSTRCRRYHNKAAFESTEYVLEETPTTNKA